MDAEKDRLVGKLFFYEEVKYESGLEDKDGEELEHYIDAYCTVREEIYEIMSSYGLTDED